MQFIKVKAHSGNDHNDNADQLAKTSCHLPLPVSGGPDDLSSVPPPPPFPLPSHGPTQPKVSMTFPLTQPSKPTAKHTFRKNSGYITNCVSLNDLYNCFKPRLNPPDLQSSHFNMDCLHKQNTRAHLQDHTSPPSCFPMLNSEVTVPDIKQVKSYLSLHPHSNTSGIDNSTYSLIMDLNNSNLCNLYCKVPTAWLITLLSALPKQGKDLSDANNYCAIVLESCFLKFGTLLVLHKLTNAAELSNLISLSQNGFHTGHRTHNNAFILCSLIEHTCKRNQTLFVAFVDISNTFPSTNHNGLWNCLKDLGLTGMYYDWLQNLYTDMCFHLVLGNTVSDDFVTGSGVLMGDPASPMLWNLYLSTFSLPNHPDNMVINGTCISHLEHANNMVIISTLASGLQRHINELQHWCYDNFLSLSPSKLEVMIFGNMCL
ncbi:hypothetical protein D9758_010702 [Tetrapyrgos nigripes]|uniref:Reverse transcriptase domain-containing protein n=1 Tax=Tetrapyrgos nigripes TaxID=182062 RepID=A0A8H5LPA0_9AGAR|nr:hypothetical protein D9758_010702 [Tetrapyrgos nigripes]